MLTRWVRDLLPADERAERPRSRRDGAVDSTMIVLAFLTGLLNDKNVVYGWHGYPLALRVADIVGGTVLLAGIWFWRRRWPVQFAVLAVVVGVFSTLGGIVGTIAVFTAAIRCRWQTAVLVSLFAAVMVIPGVLLYPTTGNSFLLDSVIGALITFAATGWGMFVRSRRMLVASLRAQVEQAEAEAGWRAENARQAERELIAREMHDVLAHRLSLLAVHAGALEFRSDASPEQVAWAAGVIRDNAHQALDELRSVINVARENQPAGAPERPQPTLADVPALVEESRQAGLAVSLHESPDVVEHGGELPAAAGRALYRIVQEALTNVRKHAASSPAAVEFTGRPGERIEVSVRNRCVALASALPAGPGTGLIGLRERIALAGGGLDCGPTTDGDFLVRAWLPWSTPAATGR